MLQIPQVHTNVSFQHIPTTPLEQRAGILVRPLPEPTPSSPYPHYVPLEQGDTVQAVLIRNVLSFPLDRNFTTMEQTIIKDVLSCPDSIDKITLFSIRPPELRFIRSVQNYYQWFVHNSSNRNPSLLLNINFFKCAWVNGIDHHIQVRLAAIPFILQHEACPENMRLLLFSLLHNNDHYFFSYTNFCEMKLLFLSTNVQDNYQLPIIVLPPVKPTQTNRFLIHLLLSLGSYSNESELFNVTSIIESFKNAKLTGNFSSNGESTMNDVLYITKKYIEEQLFFVPSGTRTFDRYTIASFQVIKGALLESRQISFDMPSFLYTSLVTTANQHSLEIRQQLTYNLIETLKGEPGAPDSNLLHNATKTSPLDWNPCIKRLPNQSEISYSEHLHTSKLLQKSIDDYISVGSSSPSCIIIIGGPGTGKTFQLKQACLYALSKGMNVLMTALMSERAIILGGRHLHYLFCIPGFEYKSIHQLSDSIIRNLNRKPAFLYTLQTNDAIFIDEFEFASAEFLNALDNVLRYIRNKNTFFGGMVVFATMDVQQLPPIEGHPCLTSSLILTSFHLATLTEYVRSRTDAILQRLITLVRKLQPLTEDEKKEFVHLIVTYCTHVDNWNDYRIPVDAIRILGTRKGVHVAETMYYDKIREQGLTIISQKSQDFENLKTSHGTWKPASSKVTQRLNKLVREPEVLQLHQGLLVEATFNNGLEWSNGQIGLIVELPHPTLINQWKSFPLLLAPPGIRSLPRDPFTIESLLNHGWKMTNMKPAPELVHHCYRGIFGKRYQYGIRPLAATTIHKAMGSDFDKIVSCIYDDGSHDFRLWEKAQVLVLISRVHCAKDIIFIGDKFQTAQRLLELISIQPKYALYMEYIINCLTQVFVLLNVRNQMKFNTDIHIFL